MSYFSTDFGMLLFKADTFEQIIGTYFTSDPRWWWNPTTTICSMALSGSWSVMFTFQLIPSCCLLRDKLFKKTIFIKPPSWIRERVAWGRALLLVPRFLVSLNLNYAWNTYSTPWANLFYQKLPIPSHNNNGNTSLLHGWNCLESPSFWHWFYNSGVSVNPVTPKIFSICHTIHMMLFKKIWYWID